MRVIPVIALACGLAPALSAQARLGTIAVILERELRSALRGLARAAAAAGDTPAAERARGQLRAIHHAADADAGAMP